MNERLFLENQPKSARIVSNILNEEVKKHDANRDLLVAFDDDFVAQQKFWDSDQKGHRTIKTGDYAKHCPVDDRRRFQTISF